MVYSTDIILNIIRAKRELGRNIFVCGNGGSASNAEHFSNDLFSKGVRAHCLNSNTAIITMIANDYGYRYIFSKQLELFADPGDLVIMVSNSGTSENIKEVLKMDIEKVAIFGGDGTPGDMESSHQEMMHEICEKL